MTYLIDATYVIDFFRGQPYARSLYPTLVGDGLSLSIITHMELWEGVYGNPDPQAAARQLWQFLRPPRILPFPRRVPQRTAQLRREMRRRRLPLEQRALDILIAGTALAHDR
jgi:predicted nucleic acid-binding protein